MLSKRLLREGNEDSSELPAGEYKRGRIIASVLRGVRNARSLPDYVPRLEPMIRSLVREEVDRVFHLSLRSSQNHIVFSGSRTLQLHFDRKLPPTLFTCSRVVSEDDKPLKIVLYDSVSKTIITSGRLSSAKVEIVVLDGDFSYDDQEDWAKEEFDTKVLRSREGRRPLLTGGIIVSLNQGVGFVGDLSFTDNSSWIRSGRFRLGAKMHSSCPEVRIREGISTPFKVKDHRGVFYQKHRPPALDDEVWRLEKISKDGKSHNRLDQYKITSVRDFLRLYFRDQVSLRSILGNISNRTWETITKHALTCVLDNNLYVYRDAQGFAILLDSIYRVVGVTFDGQNFESLDQINAYQRRAVQDLKQRAYASLNDLILVDGRSVFGYPMLLSSFNNPELSLQSFGLPVEQDQVQTTISSHPTTSPYNFEVERDVSSFEVSFGDTSHQMEGFGPTLGSSFATSNANNELYDGGQTWASGVDYGISHQLIDDPLTSNNFQVGSSPWQGNGLFLGPSSHDIGFVSSNSGFHKPQIGKTKTSWCKVLAAVKWRILARRNVAARKGKTSTATSGFFDF